MQHRFRCNGSMLLFVCLALAPALLFADNRPERSITTVAGITAVPSNKWNAGIFMKPVHDYLYTDFDETALTTYDSAITFNKLGLATGVSATTDDNMIGRINTYMGYIGIRSFMLRLQSGRMKGRAVWTHTPLASIASTTTFDNSFINIDLIRYGTFLDGAGYWGIGYNSFSVPALIDTYYRNRSGDDIYGLPVYDPCLSIKTYTLMFGFDTFMGSLRTANTKTENLSFGKSGFGMFFETQDKIGFGEATISSQTVATARLLNGNRSPVGETFTPAIIDYNLSIGIKWSAHAGSLGIAAGIGYNIGGFVMVPFSRALSDASEMGFLPTLELGHRGPVFKLYAAW